MKARNYLEIEYSGYRLERHQEDASLEITEAGLRAALSLIMRDSLKPVTISFGIVLLLASVTIQVFPTIAGAWVLSGACAILAAIFFSLHLALCEWKIPSGWANPLGGLIAIFGWLICTLAMFFNPEPYHTTSYLLLVIAAGVLLLSTRWLLSVIAMTGIGWGSLVWAAAPSPLWVHFGFALFVATALALAVHSIHIQTLRRLETLRVRETRLAERAELMRKIAASQEEERRRISRELHDQTGQCVTALKYGLESLKTSLLEAPQAQRQLAQMCEIAGRLDQEIDQLTYALRPPLLEAGLGAALEHYLAVWRRQSRIPVDFDDSGWSGRLTEEIETAVYRATQEALTNVFKHARASRVSVSLKDWRQGLEVVIRDDGCGFDPAAISGEPDYPNSLGRQGLLNMRERMALVGGTLSVESAPGRGTAIRIKILEQSTETGEP